MPALRFRIDKLMTWIYYGRIAAGGWMTVTMQGSFIVIGKVFVFAQTVG